MKENMMDRILLAMAAFLVIFIIAMTVIFCVYQTVPDTLITAVAGLCGSECGFMGVIKTAKVLNEKSKEINMGAEDDPAELGLESWELDES